jgi:hypothetical protein
LGKHEFEGKCGARRLTASLAATVVLIVLELIGLSLSAQTHGLGLFAFYTEDSNILSLVASIVYACLLMRQIVSGRHVPTWAAKLRYVSVCCLTLTFLVVAFVLAPLAGQNGYALMFLSGSMLYFHLLCPVLAVLSLLVVDPRGATDLGDARLVLVPTGLYAVVLVSLNLVGAVSGPYPFLRVYDQPVWASACWLVAIVGGAYLIALAIAWVQLCLCKGN